MILGGIMRYAHKAAKLPGLTATGHGPRATSHVYKLKKPTKTSTLSRTLGRSNVDLKVDFGSTSRLILIDFGRL
jgi:hypothetical protein